MLRVILLFLFGDINDLWLCSPLIPYVGSNFYLLALGQEEILGKAYDLKVSQFNEQRESLMSEADNCYSKYYFFNFISRYQCRDVHDEQMRNLVAAFASLDIHEPPTCKLNINLKPHFAKLKAIDYDTITRDGMQCTSSISLRPPNIDCLKEFARGVKGWETKYGDKIKCDRIKLEPRAVCALDFLYLRIN
jgi:hypothetical protein